MPKKIRLLINCVFSILLFLLLFFKLERTFSHWWELSERYGFNEGTPPLLILLVVFGVYPMILLTALSVWLRGIAPIVLSAVGMCGAFILYCFETFIVSLYKAYNDSSYAGFDPIVSCMTYIIAFFMLAVSIAEVVLRRKGRPR